MTHHSTHLFSSVNRRWAVKEDKIELVELLIELHRRGALASSDID
jgi:hypothetical protein